MIVFRLWPERGSLFVRVVVHPTKKALHARYRTDCPDGRPLGRDCIGRCTEVHLASTRPSGGWRRDPCIAEVHLIRSQLGMEVITHELFHATCAWARRVGFPVARLVAEDSVNEDEERIAYVHGRLCRQFVARAIDAGLYREGNTCEAAA